MSWETWTTYLTGLSDRSRWWQAARTEPVELTGDDARIALRNA